MIRRRTWLASLGGAALTGLTGLGGCSQEPIVTLRAMAFATPAELMLWGLDAGDAEALGRTLWSAMDGLEQRFRQDDAGLRSMLPMPHDGLASTDADILLRGLALDQAEPLLRHDGLDGALLTLGQHLLAVGERGFRPWHVGVPDPQTGRMLLGCDLYATERLVTVSRYASYRPSAALSPQPPAVGADACASCSVILRGAKGAAAAAVAAQLYRAAATGWRALAAQLGADTVLWVNRNGRIEATPNFAGRALLANAQRQLVTGH